jgi:putative ABC transport system ATP-binding protein
LPEDELAVFRGRNIGFVFQSFQLVPTLTALENVRVPAELLGDGALAARAEELLARVGLQDRMDHFPAQLSGGEMQRVAIARASINRPKVLLADEPTGNLDSVAGEHVLQLLLEANQHCTLILVTHDAELAGRADREVRLKDGRIVEVVERRAVSQANPIVVS